MRIDIRVEQATDHPLILGIACGSRRFEELNALHAHQTLLCVQPMQQQRGIGRCLIE